jgi:hypothetical protein
VGRACRGPSPGERSRAELLDIGFRLISRFLCLCNFAREPDRRVDLFRHQGLDFRVAIGGHGGRLARGRHPLVRKRFARRNLAGCVRREARLAAATEVPSIRGVLHELGSRPMPAQTTTAQTTNLFLLEDLEDARRTSELARSDLDALQTVAETKDS